MDVYTRERQLEQELTGRIEEHVPGTEVLAVELLGPNRFCVFIDHPAGVDHALCERVTREIDDYRREYTIDVSSPGLEPPVRKPAHFANAVGRSSGCVATSCAPANAEYDTPTTASLEKLKPSFFNRAGSSEAASR